MIESVDTIVKSIASRMQSGQRFIVAICGAPASGKSTLADTLCKEFNENKNSFAAVLPMDGFHLDNTILSSRGILSIKGAPETFDIDGFAAILARIHAGNRDVIVPVFDRKLDIARAGGNLIKATTKLIIVEGNYLLLDRPEWSQMACNFDLSVFLDVPIATLEKRLIQRWLDHGLDLAAATNRALSNDIKNAELVNRNSLSADIRLSETERDDSFVKETLAC